MGMYTDGSVIGGVVLTVLGISAIFSLLMILWYFWALSRLFPALGLPAAHGWIPVYNVWRLIERGGGPGWIVLLGLVPGLAIVVYIMLVISIHRIHQEKGQGAGMTVLGALIPPLWATILGTRLLHGEGGGYARQSSSSRVGVVEYGPDGQVYPVLGAPGSRPGTQARPAPPTAATPTRHPASTANLSQLFDTTGPRKAEAPSPVQPQYVAPARVPQPPVSPGPASQHSSIPPVPPLPPVAPATPTERNPWGLSNTIDDNFQRLANEAPPERDSSLGKGAASRPFALARAAGSSSPPAPQSAASPAPTPAAPRFAPPPAAPTVAAPEPATPAPPVESEPDSGYVDDASAATVIAGALAAEPEEDLDHTIVVARGPEPRQQWVLELPDKSELLLEGDDIVVGRKPLPIDGSAVLTVPDSTRTLSKSHVRLRREGDAWTVEDLASTNGVFVFDESGEQIELDPHVPQAASEYLIFGTLEVRLRPAE